MGSSQHTEMMPLPLRSAAKAVPVLCVAGGEVLTTRR
jgi:hypothetical protein